MTRISTKKVKYIVVHCSATTPDPRLGVEDIRKWHKDKGWKDVGYHAVIRTDGTVEYGRPLDTSAEPGWQPQQGAQVAGYNAQSVGVCYIGGLSPDPGHKPMDTRTPEQKIALRILLQEWRRQFPNAEILGHRDFPDVNKECPCFDVRSWWQSFQSGA